MDHLGDSGETVRPTSDKTQSDSTISGDQAERGTIGYPRQAASAQTVSPATHADRNDVLQELWARNGRFDEPSCTRLNAETWGHWCDQADGFYESGPKLSPEARAGSQ
jgi:hypothetical protein